MQSDGPDRNRCGIASAKRRVGSERHRGGLQVLDGTPV
jgi:hypothetical protein